MVYEDPTRSKKSVIIIYEEGDRGNTSDGRLTGSVITICFAAASAGLTFGYDVSLISGGVRKMESFLLKFFPTVLHDRKKNISAVGQFCVAYSPKLAAYVSCMFIAAIFSSLLAGRLTTSVGRKGALIIGGMIYLIGVSIHTIAVNVGMLVVGRTLTGFGIGFTNQTAPIYLAEMAPTKWRGAIGSGYQIFLWAGVIGGNWVNFFLTKSLNPNNWRIAIGLSGFPATIMLVISIFIPDTPSSLILRGKVQQALKSLNQVRGVNADTQNELRYLIKYNEDMKMATETPYQMLLERKYRPQLFFAIALPAFQQLVGRNLNNMIGPVIVESMGTSLERLPAVFIIQDIIFMLCLLAAAYLVDRIGRRILLIQAGFQIFLGQILLALLMELRGEPTGTSMFPERAAMLALWVRCFVGMAIAWSWGPLQSILNCEMLPIEIRSAGQGLATAVSFGLHFVTIQTGYPLLCRLKYGLFLIYAGLTLFVTIFVMYFLPETKRIPLECMDIIWRKHWYWRRFVDRQTTISKSQVESVPGHDDQLNETESDSVQLAR